MGSPHWRVGSRSDGAHRHAARKRRGIPSRARRRSAARGTGEAARRHELGGWGAPTGGGSQASRPTATGHECEARVGCTATGWGKGAIDGAPQSKRGGGEPKRRGTGAVVESGRWRGAGDGTGCQAAHRFGAALPRQSGGAMGTSRPTATGPRLYARTADIDRGCTPSPAKRHGNAPYCHAARQRRTHGAHDGRGSGGGRALLMAPHNRSAGGEIGVLSVFTKGIRPEYVFSSHRRSTSSVSGLLPLTISPVSHSVLFPSMPEWDIFLALPLWRQRAG